MEEANLVKDLALILISAGVFTIISKALKQPLILGYIVAGFLVGPHMGLFPTVTSTAEVKEQSPFYAQALHIGVVTAHLHGACSVVLYVGVVSLCLEPLGLQ